MDRYAIFGDSYISRLEKYTNGRLEFRKTHKFFGVSGMSTRRKFNEMFDHLLDYRPKYVFINLEGNDITAESDAHIIYMDIIDIVEKLYISGIERVFVASILERGKFPYWTGLNHKRFTVIRRYINKKLNYYLGSDFVQVGKRLMFPRHNDSDLVHPGIQQGGMKIFKHEILKAFRRTL